MLTKRHSILLGAISFIVAGTVAGASAQTLSAEDALIGANEYAISCAACHGTDGTGHGEFAKVLTVAPADLTQLSKYNKGVFPLQRVYDVIDGRNEVAGHGTRDMPIWGMRYAAEAAMKLDPNEGPYFPMDIQLTVRARILELVYYIQSIQKP